MIQSRCYSGFMINSFVAVKEHLPKEIFEKIKKLGFDQFLKDVDVLVNPFHLNDLVGHYIGDRKFSVRDKVLDFTSDDVGSVLGILETGMEICIGRYDKTGIEISFWRKYFNVTQVKR